MNSISTRLVGVLGLAVLVSGCSPSEKPEKAEEEKPVLLFKSHAQSDSQYLVENILGDVAELAAYAGTGKAPAPDAISVDAQEQEKQRVDSPTYQCEIKTGQEKAGLKFTLKIDRPIWAPELYEGPAKDLLGRAGYKPANTSGGAHKDLGLMAKLPELSATELELANQAVSAELEKEFANPDLHEQAALVLGVFGLRESAGYFHDTRHVLCRMTAHLALARALGGGKGESAEGQLADVLLYALMNNRQTAFEKLERFGQTPKSEVWTRALKARLTGDYRELAARKTLTPLEILMRLQAHGQQVGMDAAWAQLKETVKKARVDYCRAVAEVGHGVQLGHELSRMALPLEWAELAEVYKLSRGGKISAEKTAGILNEKARHCFETTPEGTVRLRVIGWGEWADFCQRHLCHAVGNTFNFMQYKWGVPEEAQQFKEATRKLVAGLRLYPFLRRMNATQADEYRQSIEEGVARVRETPELIPLASWLYLHYYAPDGIPFDNRACGSGFEDWNKHYAPPGTAYDLCSRLVKVDPTTNNLAFYERLLALAPWDGAAMHGLIKCKQSGGAKLSGDELKAIYRPILEYAPHALECVAVAYEPQPAEYERYMTLAAKSAPHNYFQLGNYFAGRKEEDKAARYYEQAVALVLDDVWVANQSDWLVKYYFRKGRITEADHLANRAAEVYSHSGLMTKSDLLFLEKKYAESLEYVRKMDERYDRPEAIPAWIGKYKAATGDTRYDKELQAFEQKHFPNGKEPAVLADFKVKPQSGVRFEEDSALLNAAGLKRGDIIVALDGVRVYNLMQYNYLRDTLKTPELKLIVWGGMQYREVTASPPDHKFGVSLSNYRRIKK